MTKLEDRLQAIARMMELATTYTEAEAQVWKALIRHVDGACFERTGRILASGVPPERLAAQVDSGLAVRTATQALQHLVERGHLVVFTDATGTTRYRLFLFPRAPAGRNHGPCPARS